MNTKTFAAIQIPTDKRGAVRSYLKGRPGWEAFCLSNGIESRDAKNAHLIDFAIASGYEAEVRAIISGGAAVPAHVMPSVLAEALFTPLKVAETPEEIDAVVAEAKAYAPTLVDNAPFEPVTLSPEEIAMICEPFEVEPVTDNEARDAEIEAPIAANDILAPVDQFLSPYVRAQIEAALAPILAAANKPPVEVVREVEVIKEVIKEVAALAPVAKGAMPYAIKGNKVPLGKLFGFKGAYAKMEVHLWESHGAAPAQDPFYVVDPYNMAMLATALDNGENVWLVGPGGSGKTSAPQQFCAYTNRPFVKISFTRNSHVDDMVGGQGVKNGNSGWEDGVLIEAMKRPGTVILLDEISLAPAGVQGLYQGAADEHRTYTLPTGEKVVAAPGVVFCVADNTNGNGDDTGLYQGTNQCNGALVNRFAVMLRIDYMSVETEALALHQRCPKAPLAACVHMAEFVARARKLPSMENAILSLRNMCAFTRRVLIGFSPKQAAEVTILNQMVPQDRAALETLFTLAWEKDFADLIAGKEVQAPAPSVFGVGADNGAFDDEVTATLNR